MDKKISRKHQISTTSTYWNEIKIERLRSNFNDMNDFILILLSKGLEVIQNERKEKQ